MNEKPLERLHFFNGQRLQAEDFRLEQDYHMRVRRWLNRSLYTSGIASGLEVRKVPGSPSVIVGPGLALDHFGREIILLDERPVPLQGRGIHYLTIRYQEDTTARQDACCPPASSSKNHTASGGPSRILAEPVLEWSTRLPHEESGRVLLARVELSAGCKDVKVLDTSVRRYVGAASAAKVRQYALEGVRELDARNPTCIYFHVRGRQPSSVTLYLRAERMPTYFYTEVGNHTHIASVSVGKLTIPAHTHGVLSSPGIGSTKPSGEHTPEISTVTARVDKDVWKVFQLEGGVVPIIGDIIAAGGKAALLVDEAVNPEAVFRPLTLSPHVFWPHAPTSLLGAGVHTPVDMKITLAPVSGHSHGIDEYPLQEYPLGGTASVQNSGVTDNRPDYSARLAAPLMFVDNLQISIGPTGHAIPKTADILRQLSDSNPTDWRGKIKLGDGGTTLTTIDVLQENGTGAIRLDFLPDMSFGEGEYVIELSVPAGPKDQPNGGRIHYNLYIE